MHSFLDTLTALRDTLVAHEIRYVIIGGIAVQHWSEPRFTRDIDATIVVQPGKEEAALAVLTSVFTPRIPDYVQFALQYRVIPLTSLQGVDLDISFGLPGYEETVLERSEEVVIAGVTFPICSAEDLIIHKMVAGRPQDISDIQGVLLRQEGKLDFKYIDEWLTQFSELLEGADLVGMFERLRKELLNIDEEN
ncbi:MAG: nucleotidyl transferase AbiEii/AbiGii toxin family protein [Desulfuromonadaceae bacterium]